MGSSCSKCCCECCNCCVSTVGDEPGTDPNVGDVIANPDVDVTDPSTANKHKQTCTNDICGLKDSKFIIQAGAYFVNMENKSLAADIPEVQPLHDQCKYGDHYLAQYIIHYQRDKVQGRKKMFVGRGADL